MTMDQIVPLGVASVMAFFAIVLGLVALYARGS